MYSPTSALRATTFLCATALTMSAFTTQAHAVALNIMNGETVTLDGSVTDIDGSSFIAAGGTLIANNTRSTRQTGDLLNEGSIEMQGRRYSIVFDATVTNKGSITIEEGTELSVQTGLDNTTDGTITNNGFIGWVGAVNNGNIENNGLTRVSGVTAASPSGTGSVTNTGVFEVFGENFSGAEFSQTGGLLTVYNESAVLDFDTVQITGGAVEGDGTIGGDVEVTGARIEVGRFGDFGTLKFSERLTVQAGSTLQFVAYADLTADPALLLKDEIYVAGPVALAAGTVFDIDAFLFNWDPKVPGRLDWDLLIADSFAFSDLDGFVFDYESNVNAALYDSSSNEFNPDALYTTSIFDMADGRQSVRLTVETVAPVPLPASALLLLGGLAGLGAFERRRRASC